MVSFHLLLLVVASSCSVGSANIRASSEVGRRILQNARRVEDKNYGANGYVNYFEGNYGNNNNGNNGNNNNNNGYNMQQTEWQWYSNYMLLGSSWLSEYSIKFQGCYDTFKWNKDAMDAEDVRVQTRHVVRFRLCPSKTCSTQSSDGCSNSYGDYIIDLNSYLEAYVQAKMAFEEWYNFEQADQNQANQNGYNYYDENFDVLDFMQCADSGIEMEVDEYAQYYKNNNGGNQQDDGGYENNNYFIGPYCAEQGGAILMGMFKDDACTIAADSSGGLNAYFDSTGYYLPFSDRSMIEFDCFSCKEPENYNYNQYNQGQGNNNGNNNKNNYGDDDDDNIQEFCETAYLKSGKCEANLPSSYFNMYKKKNNKACNYIEGVKVIRDDGSIVTTHRKSPGHLSSDKAGVAMLGIFGAAFAGLAAYVYYLKKKFDRASVDLS